MIISLPLIGSYHPSGRNLKVFTLKVAKCFVRGLVPASVHDCALLPVGDVIGAHLAVAPFAQISPSSSSSSPHSTPHTSITGMNTIHKRNYNLFNFFSLFFYSFFIVNRIRTARTETGIWRRERRDFMPLVHGGCVIEKSLSASCRASHL